MRDVVEVVRGEVEGGGYAEEAEFSILANAKAFRILIDGLYANKHLAIVREICSNALDSHVMAGCPERPFDVHLPHRFGPEFRVRDYGTGLSHADVMKLYTTVFKSTKDGENLSVGKFGLGSKTPFAYSDQFSVTSWYNGMKRLYNAFIDTSGKPKIALFHEEPSDEPNGLDVAFAVQPQDMPLFVSAAKEALIGFDVFPNMTGARVTSEEVQGTVHVSGTGWKMVSTHWGYGVARVRQGCVTYPIDLNAIIADLDHPGLRTLARSNLIVDVPIGSVEVTPSRESLQYDPITRANIVARLKEVLEEAATPYKNVFEGVKNIRDAHERWKTISQQVRAAFPSDLAEAFLKGNRWRGQRPSDLFGSVEVRFEKAKVKAIVLSTGRGGMPPSFRDEYLDSALYTGFDYSYVFFLQEPGQRITHAVKRVKNYIAEKSLSSHNTKFLWVEATEAGLKRLAVLLRRPKNISVVRLADLPSPYAGRTGVKRQKGVYEVKKWTADGWQPTRISVDTDGICAWQSFDDVKSKGGTILSSFASLANAIKHAIKCGVFSEDDEFYVIPGRAQKAFRAREAEWDCLLSTLVEGAKTVWDEKQEEAYTVANFHQGVYVDSKWKEFYNALHGKVNDATSPAGLFLSAYEVVTGDKVATKTALTEEEEAARALRLGLRSYAGFPDTTTTLKTLDATKQTLLEDFHKKIKAFENTYPLLAECGWSVSTRMAKAAPGYVNAVDSGQVI